MPTAGSATDPALGSYRAAAAVLSSFDSEALHPVDPAFVGNESVVLDLLDECQRLRDAEGRSRWMLANSVRRQALRELGTPEALRQALAANSPRPADPLQRAFEACVAGQGLALAGGPAEELAAALQVRDWLDGIVPNLPDRSALVQQLEWQQLLQPFRMLVGDTFRGRTRQLARLAAFAAESDGFRSLALAKPLMIYGAGGVGKSTLLAKFILDAVESDAGRELPFCYWDFDRVTLAPEEPLTLLAELVLQFGLRYPEIAGEARDLRQRWLAQLAESAGARRTVEAKGGARPGIEYRGAAQRSMEESRSDLDRPLEEFAKLTYELPQHSSGRFLLVLDTFERVQDVSFEFTVALYDFLDRLQRVFPRMRVIISGRARVDRRFAHQPYKLGNLDKSAVAGYLAARGVTTPALADAIYRRVGGDPLSLRLLVECLRQAYGELAGLTALPADFDALTMDNELNQGWLYRRYLDRIGDEEIRRLAHPGLVLRRVTPGLIRHVLAGPCHVEVPTDDVAQDLFDRLARQASLVQLSRHDELSYRPDIRKRMLRGLVQTKGAAVYEIHKAAVAYYEAQPATVEARAEEIYHRLFIAAGWNEIEQRWLPGIERVLLDAVDDAPPEVRGKLIAALKVTSFKFDWSQADAASREANAEARARNWIAVNKLPDALQVLGQIRDRLPGSGLYRLEAQALEGLGRYPEALISVNEGLFSARKAADAGLEIDLLLVAVRASEKLGRYVEATGYLKQAIAPALKSPDDDILVLELYMHGLRLCRLDPASCAADVTPLRKQAGDRLSALFDELARRNALLLIDVVEELASEQPDLLARTAARFPTTFQSESGQKQAVAWLKGWVKGTAGQSSAGDANALPEVAHLMAAGQRPAAMQAAGLPPSAGWPDLLARLFGPFPAPQASVSRLAALLRTALLSVRSDAPANAEVLSHIWQALFAAFPQRSELEAFLAAGFPELLAEFKPVSAYTDALIRLAETCERLGITERLVNQALQARPDAQELLDLQRLLTAASAVAAGEPVVGLQISHVHTTGNITISGIIGAAQMSHVVVGGNLNIYNRSMPAEALAWLPKAAPINGVDLTGPVWVSPELVMNWAFGMRQAMRAVCRVDMAKGLCTGFLVAPDLLMVPDHVVPELTSIGDARATFDLRHDLTGNLGQSTAYRFADDWLVWNSAALDLALVRLVGAPGNDLVPNESDARRGWLTLTGDAVAAGQSVFMLHHGLGGPQVLEYAGAETGTDGKLNLSLLRAIGAPGAAGAPCFTAGWQVIAMRLGRRNEPGRERELLTTWARDWLADTAFTEMLNRHLPQTRAGETPEARLARLRQVLVDSFSYDELQALAQELSVAWEMLGGATVSEKAAALVAALDEQGRLDTLVQRGSDLRPHGAWR